MSEHTRSPVEQFHAAIAAKFRVQRKYHELHPMEQMQLVQAINMILQVVRDA